MSANGKQRFFRCVPTTDSLPKPGTKVMSLEYHLGRAIMGAKQTKKM